MTRVPACFRYPVLLAFAIACGPENAAAQLPFEREPIAYSKTSASDPIAVLQKGIESGQDSLRYDAHYGYLLSLLEQLDVPSWSQTLVFSKTSLQRHLISPSNPRAIYFNDETYVGWIPNGELIEMASTDPMLGSVFYTIEQTTQGAGAIERRTERCLFCHGSSDTGRVPGLIMKSAYTDAKGNRVFPRASIHPNPSGPLQNRWAGWFATGSLGTQRHLGNLMIDSNQSVTADNVSANTNVADLSPWFDVSQYLTPHSDIVALLVLQHQVAIHNLLTDVNHRARVLLHLASLQNREQGRAEDFLSAEDQIQLDQLAERLADGLLMVGDTPLSERITGTSGFAKKFPEKGPHDSAGRSLRQLDLQRSLFRYRCSYLIYSESFDALPKPLLELSYRRLFHVLSSQDRRDKYRHLSVTERSVILQILRETKTNLPATWTAKN